MLNVLVPHAEVSQKAWTYRQTVPTLSPMGVDLRIFVEASYAMYMGDNPLHSNYNSPPLAAWVFFPFNLMSYEMAYEVQFTVITVANFAALVLLFFLLRSAYLATAAPDPVPVCILGLAFLAACFSQFSGYPFEFSLERGNYDSLALLAICSGAWLVRYRPTACWLQVLLFSFAAHLKIYPAILLFIPLWQHGLRALLPLTLINASMLFCFGFDRGMEFLVGLYHYSLHPYIWAGNHSAAAFATLVLEPRLASLLPAKAVHVVAITLLLMLPLALWIYGTMKLLRHGFSGKNTILAISLATPLMCILTSVSNDYKLVILILPACLCLVHYGLGYVHNGKLADLLGVTATLLCLLLAARSVLLPPLLWITNKYPEVLLLEILTCIAALHETRHAGPSRYSS